MNEYENGRAKEMELQTQEAWTERYGVSVQVESEKIQSRPKNQAGKYS